MNNDRLYFKFIDKESRFYEKIIDLRYNVFFKGLDLPKAIVCDEIEDSSYHLICIDKKNDIKGYARLTIMKGHVACISQSFVTEPNRGNLKIYLGINNKYVSFCKIKGIKKIVGSVRVKQISILRRFGCEVVGEPYPSKKTGILHQNVEYIIN